MPKDWPHPLDPPPTRWGKRRLIIEGVVLVLLMLVSIASAFGRDRPVPARGTAFQCSAIAVWDGDGPIWCAEGPRIRLAGINTRELDGSCRRGMRCPAMSGPAARSTLVDLLGGARGQLPSGHVKVAGTRLSCRSLGPDRYRRTLAVCRSAAGDLGNLLIRRRAAI